MTLSIGSRSPAKRHIGPVDRYVPASLIACGNWPSLLTTPETNNKAYKLQNTFTYTSDVRHLCSSISTAYTRTSVSPRRTCGGLVPEDTVKKARHSNAAADIRADSEHRPARGNQTSLATCNSRRTLKLTCLKRTTIDCIVFKADRKTAHAEECGALLVTDFIAVGTAKFK